jgi:single-stranded DNA-specific DHH superfamily exonuclease
MLTAKQIKEIKNHLDKAQNPLFFFDNDPDGLCSFLLLQRYIGRGKGVAIKSFPELTAEYIRKVKELNTDYIFILDKPVISEEFFKEIKQINIPLVWIDHHEINKKNIPEFVYYYNPLFNEPKTNEPVTALCYQVSQKKEDLWIAVVGCISDYFLPSFYSKFKKNYPDLIIDSEDLLDIYYNSQLGKIGKIFSFALKDRITNVVNMLRFLIKAKSPYEVLEETSKNKTMHKRFNEINSKYNKLIKKAKECANNFDKMLFFQYGGDMSISADLSNGLMHLFPEKIVVVVYVTGIKANISVRGEKIREIVLKAIKNLEGARGGGHENAVGAQVKIEDLEKFRENLEKLIK